MGNKENLHKGTDSRVIVATEQLTPTYEAMNEALVT